MLDQAAFTSEERYEYIALKGNSGPLAFPNPSPPPGYGSAVQLFTLNHNLNYIPFIRLYVQVGSFYYPVTGGNATVYGQPDYSDKGIQITNIIVTQEQLQVYVFDATLSGTYNVTLYYRIYAEPQL